MTELTPEEARRLADEIASTPQQARVPHGRPPEPTEHEEADRDEADELAERIRGGSW